MRTRAADQKEKESPRLTITGAMERSCVWLNEVVTRARCYIEMENENGEPEIV